MNDTWMDTHTHVSNRNADGSARPDLAHDLTAVLDGADADVRLVLSADINLYDPVRQEPDGAHQANVVIHDLCAATPGRLYGSCLVNPNYPDAALRTMEVCFERWGFVQLGEMLPYLFDFVMDSDAAERLVRQAVAYDVPVQVHISTSDAGAHPSSFGQEQMLDLFAVAERVPEARYVLAHAVGGMKASGPVIDHYVDLVEQRYGAWPRRFWVEIAQFHTPALRSALARIPHDRLLAGTDWTTRVGPPFLPYGTVFGAASAKDNPFPPSVASLIGFLKQAGASDETVRRIAWLNAAELLRLPAEA